MFPDFLGIGAQKAGTTWLHHNLSKHPRVWLPPVKELHYLDRDPPPLRKRLTKRTETLRIARGHFARTLAGLGRHASLDDLGWATRYLFAPRDDRWYASLFPDGFDGVCGEICPGYATVGSERVAHIHALMPDARIIYLVRDPIDRAWSHAVMHFHKPNFAGLDAAGRRAIEEHLRADKTRAHGAYLENLARWQARYPADQIFVGYFGQLREHPGALLKDVIEFLGLDATDASIPPDVGARRNPGKGNPIPEAFRALLAELHLGEIEALHERLPNAYTARWLERARDLRSGHGD